jgi:hypothetical protein
MQGTKLVFVLCRTLEHEPHDSKYEPCRAQNNALFCMEHWDMNHVIQNTNHAKPKTTTTTGMSHCDLAHLHLKVS